MKINDLTRPTDPELIEVEVGDVIKTGGAGLFIIIQDDDRIGALSLQDVNGIDWYDSLNQLNNEWIDENDQLVKVTLTVESGDSDEH